MKTASIVLAMALSTSSIVFAQDAEMKSIYGLDNRHNPNHVLKKLWKKVALSTAAQIEDAALTPSGNDVEITGPTLADGGVCKLQRFSKQITPARCSGFLVAPNLLVTAGHCITGNADCANYKWVFDFTQSNAIDSSTIRVKSSSVYSCSKIIERALDKNTKNDFALIQLDRAVTDRDALSFRTEGKVADKTHLVVIGHPSGLPTKIAGGAKVRANTNPVFFESNLDTFGGNSGSAVIDAKTGSVEGILVRGNEDYRPRWWIGGCQVVKRYGNRHAPAEEVTRITNIKSLH